MAEDLYRSLELDRNATEAEIKSAYKKMARKHHPDVNKDPGAEAKFKEIQKAYSILSDPQKKAQYDQYGVTDDQQFAGGGGAGGFGGFSDSFEDIFDVFFGGQRGGGGRSSRSSGRQGADLRYDLEITLEEAAHGVKKELNITHLGSCSRCKGSGAQPGTSSASCGQCHGSGQVKHIQRTILGSFSQVGPCPTCSGTGKVIKNPCLLCHGRGVERAKKKISVDIPGGVDTGTRLRVSGEGDAGESGGGTGDLYVVIHVKNHAYFKRQDANIYLEVELPYTDVLLGTEIEVPTLEGSANLKIPSGTQPNTVFRVKGKGVKHLKGFGHGDQFVTVKVHIPKHLSGKEKQLVQELGDLQQKPRSYMDYVKR